MPLEVHAWYCVSDILHFNDFCVCRQELLLFYEIRKELLWDVSEAYHFSVPVVTKYYKIIHVLKVNVTTVSEHEDSIFGRMRRNIDR